MQNGCRGVGCPYDFLLTQAVGPELRWAVLWAGPSCAPYGAGDCCNKMLSTCLVHATSRTVGLRQLSGHPGREGPWCKPSWVCWTSTIRARGAVTQAKHGEMQAGAGSSERCCMHLKTACCFVPKNCLSPFSPLLAYFTQVCLDKGNTRRLVTCLGLSAFGSSPGIQCLGVQALPRRDRFENGARNLGRWICE